MDTSSTRVECTSSAPNHPFSSQNSRPSTPQVTPPSPMDVVTDVYSYDRAAGTFGIGTL